MTLPAAGQISLGQVEGELGLSGPVSLGQSQVRQLAGALSGQIDLNALHGKAVVTGKVGSRPSTYASSGVGNVQNPTNAFNGGTSLTVDTSSFAQVNPGGGNSAYTTTWSGFSGSAAVAGVLHIYGLTEFLDDGDGGGATSSIEYSLNNGSTWNLISGAEGVNTDYHTGAISVAPANIKVRATGTSENWGGQWDAFARVYDIVFIPN